jgi:hypothetical protein
MIDGIWVVRRRIVKIGISDRDVASCGISSPVEFPDRALNELMCQLPGMVSPFGIWA